MTLDDLGDLGRELRQRVGSQLRADAEEAERDAAMAALRRRGVREVATELAARHDGVVVETVTGQRVTGTAARAAGDLLVVVAATGRADVNLAAVVALRRSPASSPPPPAAATTEAASFKARLREHELAGTVVALSRVPDGGERQGRIATVAVDHLIWHDRDGAETIVALAAVTHVTTRDDPR